MLFTLYYFGPPNISSPMTDIVKAYVQLRNKLAAEKASIESRLEKLNAALKSAAAPMPAAVAVVAAVATKSVKPGKIKRRKISAEGRAKMAAAAKARWAKRKAAGKRTL